MSHLIFLGGQSSSHFPKGGLSQPLAIVLGEEEVVRADLAGHRDPLQLGFFDDLDLVLPGNMADVHRSVVKRSWSQVKLSFKIRSINLKSHLSNKG